MDQLNQAAIDWIAVDWGTTHCRAWAMSVQNQPLAGAKSADGMSAVRPGQFETTLLALLAPWLSDSRTMPVLACGMVGARQGWQEVPYVSVPCSPVQFEHAQTISNTDSRIRVQLLPGLSQDSPADVMRGEETQIAGLLAGQPDFDGMICMPGTHTKWVSVSGGLVTQFKSCMTGELFSLLEKQSVLKHSVSGDGFDQQHFDQTISEICSQSEHTGISDLFSIRASDLLHGVPAAQSRAGLSAMLIGNEVMNMKPAWQGRSVVILGTQTLSSHYLRTLSHAGADARCVDGDGLTLAGLVAANISINQQESR